MKKNYKLINLRSAIILLFAGFISSASAQYSGTYTLDSTQATSGTNFKRWKDLKDSLNLRGLNGALTINVMSNSIETVQINFNSITGSSSTNKVSINGNGKYVELNNSDAVILMNGADYFTFDNLVIRNTSTSTSLHGMRFQNSSDNNTVKNSTIEFSALTTGSTAGGAYISFSSSTSSTSTPSSISPGSFNTIDKNLMRTTNTNSPGPTVAINLVGHSSNYVGTAQNNTISNNTIQNFYYYAIRMYYTNGDQILNNDISRANATSNNCYSTVYGINSYYSYSANRPSKLDGNNMHDWPFVGATTTSGISTLYGFYTYYNYGTATYRFTMNNNTLKNLTANTNLYLGYSYYNYYFDMIGNMADNDDVTTSSSSTYNFYGWYNTYTVNSYRFNSNTIKNCDGGYYWYGIWNYYPASPANGVQQINDNIIQNNTHSYYYSYRIYSYYAQYSSTTYPVEISGNLIENNVADYYYGYNIYAYYYGTYIIQRNIIRNNKNIAGSVGYNYGIYSYYNYNQDISSNLIYGNVGYYSTYGIYAYNGTTGSYSAKIYQNTVKIDASASLYTSHYIYGLYIYLYYFTNVEVQGNILDYQNSPYAYPVYTYNTNGNTAYKWDNNSFYLNNVPNQTWYANGTSVTNYAGWAISGIPGPGERNMTTGHNFDGIMASIRFLNQNNITTQSTNPKDVYGVLRNPSKSDRGAVESTLDIAQVSNSFAPPSPVCAGYTTAPTLTFKNNFAEPVTGFTLGMTDNGVLRYTTTMTNTIPIGGTATVTFPTLLFSQAGNHTVKFFLLNADDVPNNDSMSFTFTVLKSPGGATLTQNTTLSSPAAKFVTTGKPDITFPSEKMVYDLTAPATKGYVNSDYGTKWTGIVTAKTINGVNATSTVSSNSAAPFKVTLDAPKAWEDSTIELSIIIHDILTGCDTTYKRRVLIAPKAVPGVKLPAALCEKTDLIFESLSTVSSGSIDYTWDFGDGSPISNEASPAHKYSAYGTYTVTLTTTTNPYPFTTKKVITVNITEVPAASIINTNACEGTSVKLKNGTVYGGSGVTTYTWDYGDGSAPFITTSAADKFKSYAKPGGYLVTLTASADGCTNTVTKIVYQFSKPVASFNKVSGSCLNTPFTFDNTSVIALGQAGNLWDFDDAGNKATVEDPTYTFITAGTKNVKLKVVSEFGCTDSMIVPIVVKQIPTTNYSYPFACSRTATPFTNLTTLNGEALQSYLWNFGDGFTSTATSPIKTWTSIGPRVVKLKTTLMNGCSTEESKIINVGVQPAVDFQVEDRCAGSEVPFTNNTTYTQGKIVYQWNFGDGNTSSVASPVHTFGSAVSQTYTVQLKANIVGGCADSISKTVTIQPLPTTCTFDIAGNLSAAKTSPLVFTPTGGPLTGVKYTWITGDGNSLTTTAAGTQYTYKAKGKYCITMIAANQANCECSATKCVTLNTDISTPEGMENAVSVYPNPNSGIFNVSLDATVNSNMTVNVYNTLGELVKTVIVDTNIATVDLSDFAAGVYVVKVAVDNQIATRRITVSR